MVMDEDIMEFARDGDILLVGDSNAHTVGKQVPFFDMTDEICQEYEIEELGIRDSHRM